jgi:glycosyltransferase involved in cell wall biosynthesis
VKFSVTSSFYNTSPYVEKVYESLLSQTYKNWEWIVTDDFSEESSENKLKQIAKKDSRVKYITQKHKQELYWNPHKYSSTDSDFVFILDSDDMLKPKALEVYKHFFLLNPDVFCIVSGGERVRKDGSWFNYLYGDVRNRYCCDRRTNFGETESLLPNRCFRYVKYPILDFNPDGKYQKRLNDYNLLLRIEEIGSILCINRNLSYITYREESLSNSEKLYFENNSIVNKTKNDILKDTDERRGNFLTQSFKKIHEDEFDFLKSFYYGDIEQENILSVNILSKITPRQYKVLKELYFELDIKLNSEVKETETELNFFIFGKNDDLSILKNIKKTKNTIIFFQKNNYDIKEISKFLEKQFVFRGYRNQLWAKICD